MKTLFSGIMMSALAASFAIASAAPLSAAPVFVPKSDELRSDVQDVAWRRHRGDGGFYRRGDGYYYNGHRGYRHWRHGYREYNGWWFPASAFVAGALITGAIQADRAQRSAGSAHVDWCYDHYRSYRAYDNTYQPYGGPRQQCYSPYD